MDEVQVSVKIEEVKFSSAVGTVNNIFRILVFTFGTGSFTLVLILVCVENCIAGNEKRNFKKFNKNDIVIMAKISLDRV